MLQVEETSEGQSSADSRGRLSEALAARPLLLLSGVRLAPVVSAEWCPAELAAPWLVSRAAAAADRRLATVKYG